MKNENESTQTCKQGKSYDRTDCKHFGICYLRRRHRSNPEDVTPCEDIELDPLLIQDD